MRVLLSGVWTRRGINVAVGLVILVAAGTALLGPMYSRAATEHLIDTRLEARAPNTTGLTFSVSAERAPAVGSFDDSPPPDPQTLVETASERLDDRQRNRFWPEETSWLLDEGGTIEYVGQQFVLPLYWREGICDLVELRGSCPSAEGEVLMQETLAVTLGLGTGDTIDVEYIDTVVRTRGGRTAPVDEVRLVTFRLVGTYRAETTDTPEWYDGGRLEGSEDLVVPPQRQNAVPEAAGLVVSPESMTSQSFVAGVDRPIDRRAVDLDTLDEVERLGLDYRNELAGESAGGVDLFDVTTLFDEIDAERSLFQRVVVAALVPLAVLALILLYALVSAGAVLRRPYIALAKLRGHSRRQVLSFAVSEPCFVLAVTAPVAFAAGVALTHLVAGIWLIDGIPIRPDGTAWVMFAAVVVGTVLASLLAALSVLREPLARALSSALPEAGSTRTALVVRSAVVAVAVAVVAQLVTSDDQDNQLLALLSPLFIALAVSVAGGWLLRLASRRWLASSVGARRTSSFLASRRLARRPDLANLMIPLLLSVSMVSFSVAASSASDDWRDSRARAEVGADRTYLTDVTASRLLRVTRDVDPDGRYLMAAALETGGEDLGRRLFVDSPRLAQVAAWDPTWSDDSVEALQRELAPSGDRLVFTGDEITVSVSDVELRSSLDNDSVLYLAYLDDAGEQVQTRLGVLRNGPSAELTARLGDCDESCTLEQVFIGGDSLSVHDADGSVTVTGVAVDGVPQDWRLTDEGAWRAARPFPVSLVDPPVVPSATADGLLLEVYLGKLPAEGQAPAMTSGLARVTPTTTPDVVPVVVGEATTTEPAALAGSALALDLGPDVVRGSGVDGAEQPVRVIARADALPGLGDVGELGDLETSLVEHPPPPGTTVQAQLWVASGTPQSVLDEVVDAGVPLAQTGDLDATRDELREDAFSLALRLFLVVAMATLGLAIFGVFASSVLQARWRSYEVASLRLVGLSRAALLRASILEYVAMLGLAVVLGVGSAYLVVRLVLPSLSLGTAGEFEPAPAYDTPWLVLIGVGLVMFVAAVLISVLISRRSSRRGEPASLRWAEQG